MPRRKPAECLQDLCVKAVAANLANVSWPWLSPPGDARNDELNSNPFEALRNIAK